MSLKHVVRKFDIDITFQTTIYDFVYPLLVQNVDFSHIYIH